MSLAPGQPKIRFAGHFNPGDIAGLSYVPKTIAVEKSLSGSQAENIISLPAKTFIKSVIGVVTETSASTDATILVGLDGNTDAFITGTALTADTVGNFAVFSTGYFLAASDILALEVTGHTVTNGEVKIVIEYLELAEMFQTGGVHVSL